MKRVLAILLSAALLLGLLPACNPQGVQPSDPPAEGTQDVSAAPEVTEAAGLSCSSILLSVWTRLDMGIAGGSEYYGFGDALDTGDSSQMAAYIRDAYGLEEGEWAEACIVREQGDSPIEMAVLRFADGDAAKHGEDCLRDYLRTRAGDFSGAKAQAVANALVSAGTYVGLFSVEDYALAQSTFTTMIETGEPPEQLDMMSPPSEPVDDVDELLELLLPGCEWYGDDITNVERIDSSDPDRLKSIVDGEYGLADYPWEEAAIVRGTGGSVFEIAILRVADDEKPWSLCDALTTGYLDVKEGEYARFPAQAELLGKGIAANPSGTSFVLLLVCSNPERVMWTAINLCGTNGYSSAQRHFQEKTTPAAIRDPDYPNRIKFTDPGKEDMSLYDTSAILAAWSGGDPSGLSEHDREIYDAAKTVLDEILADGMTGLEKETAIHHWLVNNVDYDWTHQDILAETPRESYEPYGGLVNRTAVCLGYATSFQLLMDMVGIECITVTGAAFYSEEDHAWNMVRLDGNWYCVDVTWDANYREQGASSGGEQEWNYFNITSDELAKNHQWDYANTPEAVTEGQGKG